MGCSYNANQFDQEFRSTKLCNWEVPKFHSKRPEIRKKVTKIISNDRGHILPGVVKPTANPWGNFKGTWQLPETITRSLANEINAQAVQRSCRNKSAKSRRSHKRINRELGVEENESNLNKDQANFDCRKEHEIIDQQKPLDLEYTPGDLTSPRQQHSSHKILLKQKDDRKSGKDPQYKLNELYLEQHQCSDLVSILNDEENKNRETIPHVLEEELNNNIDEMRKYRQVTNKPNEGGPPSPIVPAFCNFQMARKMAQENLEHQPLPDAVADKAYRRLQAQGILNPGIALEVIPYVTGIGVKNHKAGPTQCTKLRVFRPKTCGIVPHPLDKTRLTNRPQTSHEHKDNMGPMDLAICWDYRPMDPRDEPTPPKHIDGSNGSAAPAVFTLVKTPRSPTNKQTETGRSGGVFSNTLGEGTFFDRDVVRQHQYDRRKHSMERLCNCDNSVKRSNENEKVEIYRPNTTARNRDTHEVKLNKRCKSSPNLSQIANRSQESLDGNVDRCFHNEEQRCMKSKPEKKYHHHHHRHRHRSADRQIISQAYNNNTNLQNNNRTPRLCEQVQIEYKRELPEKPPNRVPFKAGIPNSHSSGTCTSYDSGCSSMTSSNVSIPKMINIPKPRNPYVKKNYTISTLIPPFACWRGGAGQGGYPEHWRLASVYQHAYKPIDQRKRPLLATVYQ